MIEEKEKIRKVVNRTYKDSVFRTLFNDEEKLIEVYNALFDTDYGKDTPVEIVTLEDVVFRTLKNDIAFVLEDTFIVLIEHQSTVCNNLPLRDLIYISTILQRMINTDALYRKKLLKIPRPTFVVFYDGKEDFPEYQEMKLSDAFLGENDEEIALQLIVKLYNINSERNSEILRKCDILRQYSIFVERVRECQDTGELTNSKMIEIITSCISNGILPEFLNKYGTEMVEMLFRELTREEDMEISRLDGYDEGRAEGEAAATLKLARNFKNAGISAEVIAENTGLSLEEIEKL